MADDREPDAVVEAGDEEMEEAGSDSSGSSDSDSDFEELNISPEDTKLLMKLEQQLHDNPGLYDSHVQVGPSAAAAAAAHRCCAQLLLPILLLTCG